MAIQARLFDGTTLEFPDETDPSVIDRVAAEETAARNKQAAQATQVKPTAEPEKDKSLFQSASGALRQFSDLVPAAGIAAVDLAESVAHALPGRNTPAQITKPIISDTDYEAARNYLEGWKSPETRLAEQQTREAKDFLPTLGAYLENPSAIVTGVGGAIPSMLGGAGLARGIVTKGVPAMYAAATGEGTVGSLLSAENIRKSQGGEDLSLGQSALAGLSGIFTGVLGVAGNKVAQKLGVADIDELLAAQKTGNIPEETKSKLVAAAKGAIAESVFEELPQSIQEQILQNVATGRPYDEGVGEAAAAGLAVSLVPGAVGGAYGQYKTNQNIVREKLATDVAAKRAAEEAALPKPVVPPTNVIYEEKLNQLLGGEANAPVISGTSREGTNLSGEPDAAESAAGAGGTDGSRVVGDRVDVGTTAVGETAEPTALTAPNGLPFPTNGQAQKFRKENNLNATYSVVKSPEGGFVLTPKAPVAKTETVVAKEETPVVKTETPVQEVAAQAKAEETPLKQVETQQAEAEALAEQLVPSEEPTIEAAPKATEVVTAEPEDLRRLEEAYKVKTTEAAKKDQVTEETIDAYNELSKEVKGQKELPAWNKLNTAEKAVYTATNKAAGPDEALKALRDFRYDQEGNVNPPKEEDAALYELNRDTAGKSHAIKMPKWHALSAEAQEAFISGLPKLTRKKTAYTGADLNSAFEQVAVKLEDEGKGVRGAHRLDLEKAKLKGTEQEAQARAQTAEEQAKAKQAEAVGKGEAISEGVKAKLVAGDINGALKDLMTSAKGIKDQYVGREVGKFTYLANVRQEVTQVVNRALAQGLDKISYESKVVTDPNDEVILRLQQESKLAEYDPKTDTFYFTPEGFDESTVLHEIVHAGTVKIINQYYTDPASLTKEHRDAVEHLIKIYDFAKPRLAGKYKNAFENLYEFVAYALTENNFQNALSEIQSRRLTKYSKFDEILGPLNKSLWSKFTEALAAMHGLVEANFQKFSWLMDDVYRIVAKQYFTTKQGMEGLYETVNVDDLDPQQKDNFDAAVDKLMASVRTAEEADLLEGIFAELDKNGQMTVGSSADLYKLNKLLAKRYDEEQKETKAEEAPAEKQKTTQVRAEKKLLGGKRGYEGNVLLEISEAFNRVLATPEAGTEVEPLAAKAPKQPKKAAGTTYPSAEAAFNAEVEALNRKSNDRLDGPTKLQKFKSVMSDKVGSYRKAVKTFQNIAEPLKRWHNRTDIAGKFIRDESKEFDNVYEQAMGAAAKAQVYYGEQVQELENTLMTQLSSLTSKFKTDAVTTLNRLQMFVTALHEPERRRLVFIKNVPLRDDVQITINGVTDTPNNFREYIFNALNNLKDTPTQTAREQAIKLRQLLDSIIFTNTGNLESQDARDRKGVLNKNTVDFMKSPNPDTYNEDSDKYIVEAGYDPQRISQFLSVLNNSEYKQEIMDTLDTVNQIEKATIELNKAGNYWSRPVDNRVAFYGFKHYVPFKGKPEKAEEANQTIYQPASEQASRDLQYYMPSFTGGRTSSADNPIAQVVTDAKKAAFLAANNKVTQAVANAVKHGLIDTVDGKRAPTKVIPFEERYRGLTPEEIMAKNTVFNYKPDGTIEVFALKDQGIIESLRQPYKIWGETTKAILRKSGAVTRFIGQGFTRFNPFFAPWNAFRDTLTNLYNINVDKGITVAGKTLGNTIWYGVFETIMGGGMITSARVTRMYNNGDIEGIKKLAQRDSFAKNFLEYAQSGGVVTYLQGVSNINQLRDMEKVMKRGSVALNFDQLKEIAAYPFDMWFNGFENTARVAAYAAIKDGLLAEGIPNAEAITEAAIATKELANFEQTGKYGAEMGSFYMFARAQATGAVRAIDSLSYIVIPADKAAADLPQEVQNDPVAMAKFKEEYNRRRIYSSLTSAALAGMGYVSFMMALAGSGDDDQGENIVEKDDMSRWTRAMRIPIPGTDYMFQLPWGFGKGAFSAWGAQFAAYNAGTQSFADMFGNSVTIGMESFIPIPASHIPVSKDVRTTAYSITDTIAPTVLRPVFEWMINMNGLGMEIQRLGSMGSTPDAFSSRVNVPQYYKETAEFLFKETGGLVNISPDLLQFFSSSYINGISLLGQNLENAALLAAGDKEFNAKTDTFILNSFVGTRADYYSREFNRIEQEIKAKKERLSGFETLDKYNEYVASHPDDVGLIEAYEKDVNTDLKKLRSERKQIMLDKNISEMERTQELKDNKLNQQYIKAQLIAKYKYLDESLKTAADKD